MSEASDPSYSTTEVLIASVRYDLGEMSMHLREADTFAREAMATMWEIERRSKATTPPVKTEEGRT
jgi:hypothetical protein